MDKLKRFTIKFWNQDIVRTAIYAVFLNLLIECINQRSVSGLVRPFTDFSLFFYNTLIVMFTLSVALLFRRRIFTYTLVSIIWIGISITNFIVLSSRKTPFTAMDFYLLNDAIKVIPVYLSVYEIILIIIAVIAVIVGLVFLFFKAPLYKKKLKRIHSLAKIGGVAIVLYFATNLLLSVGILSTQFGNLANSYRQYGLPYCFACSVVDRGISKSDDYSQEYISSIKDALDDDTETQQTVENSTETPNIIFLQLESFFDPNLVEGVTFSENPVPNFEKLLSSYSSGYLSVPVFGAGTANTEFEVQTGMNMDDFGPGEYPYRTILQSTVCESAAYDLKNLGYVTHALHNNDGTFYDRNKVFSHLGYDTFTSIEYMTDIEKTPEGWAKDKILTGEISKILDSTEGSDYVYTISTQGHGDYPSEMPEGYTPEITVSGFPDADQEVAFTYYVNQIHEMDTFLGELMEELSQRDEKTVLVLYGDHLPGFNLTEDDLVNGDLYQTQYAIWSNFDMEVTNKTLEAYQLSAYVFGKLGISEGYITKFHQKQSDSEDYLKNLKILEYDLLYGDCDLYGGSNPYEATDLQMGTYPITIDCAYNYKDYICVVGDNFTDYSSVLINDKEYDTEIINGHLLKVDGVQVQVGDTISVVQKGKDKIELSRVTKVLDSVESP